MATKPIETGSTADLVELSRKPWEYINFDTRSMTYQINLENFMEAFDIHDVFGIVSEAADPQRHIIRSASYDEDRQRVIAVCKSGQLPPTKFDDDLFRGFISSKVELLLRGKKH